MKYATIFFIFLLTLSGCIREPIPPGSSAIPDKESSYIAENKKDEKRDPALNSNTRLIKKKTARYKTFTDRSANKNFINNDSLPDKRTTIEERLTRLQQLRQAELSPDLNEPLMRGYFDRPCDTTPFKSMVELSRESGLSINFDNDILDYTDRFYTNGIRIDLVAPGLQANPACRLLTPAVYPATNYYGICLVQNMYTPSTTKLGGILYGDRPYSAYLYFGSFKISNNLAKRFRQTSELDLGIIGPNSYGEWVQRSFHNAVPTNNEPLGWEYQIQNDLILNYSLAVEKGLVSERNFELLINGKGNLGTLYTNLSAGAHARAGWINNWFASPLPMKRAMIKKGGFRTWQFYTFIKSSVQLVGYDATLQGGVFNHSSVYTIPAEDISRLTFRTSLGLNLTWNGLGIDVEQFLLSPEYQNGYWHKWVHIALRFAF